MGKIGDLIYSTMSSKEKVEHYQKIIRDKEWSFLSSEIPESSRFLDVGCGTGYTMTLAQKDLNCNCIGIDPDPGDKGVGRFSTEKKNVQHIVKGSAELIPFPDKSFDVVFCSHVLEHVNDETKALKEISRVLKDKGVLVIGMPTATMAFINWASQILFTTHIKIYEFLTGIYKAPGNFIKIFRIRSHSYPRAKSIVYDFYYYRISNWKKIVSKEFKIKKIIKPCLYPYPDFPQLFKLHTSDFASSSVFFIAEKKC